MASVIFNGFKMFLAKDLNLSTDTIKVMLVTSTYTADQDADVYISDCDNEVSGTGYTAGGATLVNKTVTQDNTDNEGVWDADDVTWANSTITARGAILYKDTGTTTTSPVICFIDFASDQTSNAGDFTISWDAEGIINIA